MIKKLKILSITKKIISTRFIIFLFADPHLLEGGEGCKNRATDPYRVFALRWSNDLNFHCRWCKICDFLLHTIRNTWVHCGTSGKDNISIQILTDINITLHD
ncbi:unnamed protein product, partial [Meganyctiphanes norvegica]